MVRFTVEVVIARPVEAVFSFVVRAENGSMWNSAVREVRKTSEGPVGVGTEYSMSRHLPQGRVENTLQVVEYEPNERYAIRVTSGPTPFFYRYTFEPLGDRTRMSLSAEGALGGAADLLSPIASIAVKRGVQANFRTLKTLLESGL